MALTKPVVKNLREVITNAVQAELDKMGLSEYKASLGTIRFDQTEMRVKLTIGTAVTGITSGFGKSSVKVGDVYRNLAGQIFTVVSLKPSAPKYKVIVERKARTFCGLKRFKMTLGHLSTMTKVS